SSWRFRPHQLVVRLITQLSQGWAYRSEVAHQYRLDERPVEQPPDGLARRAVVAGDLAHRRQEGRQEGADQGPTRRRRDVRHRLGVVDQPAEVVVRELRGAKWRLAEFADGRPSVGR